MMRQERGHCRHDRLTACDGTRALLAARLSDLRPSTLVTAALTEQTGRRPADGSASVLGGGDATNTTVNALRRTQRRGRRLRHRPRCIWHTALGIWYTTDQRGWQRSIRARTAKKRKRIATRRRCSAPCVVARWHRLDPQRTTAGRREAVADHPTGDRGS